MFGFKVISKKKIQALEEGASDVTSQTTPASRTGSSPIIDKNNYKDYEGQLNATYQMYKAEADYGGELVRGIIDTRTAFIAGGGISVFDAKPATQKYIDKFMTLNKLYGSRLITATQTGEMEGKNLLLLKASNDEVFYKDKKINGYVKLRSFSYWVNKYKIVPDSFDIEQIKKISYKDSEISDKDINIPVDKAVYVKLGGTEESITKTPARIHNVLTDCENFSRMKYDLRKNHHLFAKLLYYFKTSDAKEAKVLRALIESRDFQIGDSYAGTAEVSILDVPLGALEALKGEMVLALKVISHDTAIPIHWMAWPELMSNRATAENLLEVVNAGTTKERLIWEEKWKEAIQKSMVIAVEKGLENPDIIGDFQVRLDLISLANLKALQETWIPLYEAGMTSKQTTMSKVPGIDPAKEEALIKKETAANVEEAQNNIMNSNILDKEIIDNEDTGTE